LEERSWFRRRTFETTSSLSVCRESVPDSSRITAGWFSRRSGSRVSIHNAVRLRVLRAPSLSRNPMPPRITRKSDRRKASDRTMVGLAQPLCLSASGTERRRYESTMNLRRRKNHSVSLHHWGWTASTPCFAVAGEVFVLTSPFIERRYRNVAPAIRFNRIFSPYGVAAIDVGFQYASRKSLPQGGNDKPRRQTRMDR
jgi:hypothetical protein